MREVAHPAPEAVDVTHVLHALSDPVRLAIVGVLAERGELHCAEISTAIGGDLGKSTLSHHFGILREAGLTRARYEGQRKYLSLRTAELSERYRVLLESVLGAARGAGV